MKACNQCGITKVLEDFTPDRSTRDGKTPKCRDCRTLNVRLRSQGNLEITRRRYIGDVPDGCKWCPDCQQIKPMNEKNRSYCAECLSLRNHIAQLKRHGVTIEWYAAILDNQDGLCGACGEPETYISNGGGVRRLCIDHDHKCCPGKYSCGLCVRGLICAACNSALGNTGDDVMKLKMLINYIEKGAE